MVNIARGILLKEQFSYYFVLKCLSTPSVSIQETKALSLTLPRWRCRAARPQRWPLPPLAQAFLSSPRLPRPRALGAATRPASLRAPQGPAARATPSACWTRSCCAWVRIGGGCSGLPGPQRGEVLGMARGGTGVGLVSLVSAGPPRQGSEDRTPSHRPEQAVPAAHHCLVSSGRVADVTSLSSFIIGKWPKPQLLIAQVGSLRPAETSVI